MQFVAASFAYFSVVAAGVKILADVAHILTLSAVQTLQLPAPKLIAQPTLVERRLIAQSAPVIVKPERRVVAMNAPFVPVAVMAVNLDTAETAYVPQAVTQTPVAAKPAGPLMSDVAMVKAKPAKKYAAKSAKGPAKIRTASYSQKRAKKKLGTEIVFLIKTPAKRKTSSFARLETPGYLMFKGLLKQQS